MRRPKVFFKKEEEVDIAMEYIVEMRVYDMSVPKLLIEDDFKVITSLNVETSNDIMFINIVEHKLDIHPKYGQRSMPIKNSMDMTENEYKEFMMSIQMYMNTIKRWMNEVHLREGQRFPYTLDEFNSYVTF